MKLAIFTDIHGNLEALTAILEDIQRNPVDDVICLGDVLGIGPNPKECLAQIIQNHVKLVLGNHELYFLDGFHEKGISIEEFEYLEWERSFMDEEDRRFLKNCPLSLTYGKLQFSHFLIEDEKSHMPFYPLDVLKQENLNYGNSSTIYIGHWHRPFIKEHIYGLGSSGCVPNDQAFYYILDTNTEVLQKVEVIFDRAAFVKKIKEIEYPGKDFVARTFFGISS
ncbi:MAG: metallophosphoesterase [Anaeroplasmataceae bacterium]|nr:metallophosphoesterase [Anaeroplasmataceae bacterium]